MPRREDHEVHKGMWWGEKKEKEKCVCVYIYISVGLIANSSFRHKDIG
jgi:hypothetical protein